MAFRFQEKVLPLNFTMYLVSYNRDTRTKSEEKNFKSQTSGMKCNNIPIPTDFPWELGTKPSAVTLKFSLHCVSTMTKVHEIETPVGSVLLCGKYYQTKKQPKFKEGGVPV